MELTFNPYILLAVNGFFTAVGTIAAQFVWFEYLKPKLILWHKRAKRKRIKLKIVVKP